MVIGDQLYNTTEFDVFLAQQDDSLFELIEGRIVEKVPTQERGHIALKIGGRLQIYAEEHNLGRAYVEAHYRPTDDT